MAETRMVLLSFDDGPAPTRALDSILATLGTGRIKAEFYMRGDEVERFPSSAKKVDDEGHKIQNHSWSHIDLARAPLSKVRMELEKTQEAIRRATGQTPTRVRPPYGNGGWPNQIDPELQSVAASLSLEIKNWDVDTEDWKAPMGLGKTQMIRNELMRAVDSPIDILMHVLPQTATDLPGFIKLLREWRCDFATP